MTETHGGKRVPIGDALPGVTLQPLADGREAAAVYALIKTRNAGGDSGWSYETATGKRHQVRYCTPNRTQTKKRGFTTKREAQEFAASVEVHNYRGEYISHQAGQATIVELGPPWLVRQSAHLKPSSLLALEVGWRVHVEPRWRDVRVADMNRTIIQDWVAELGKNRSATTVRRAYGVLWSILHDAVEDRRVIANPAKGVKTEQGDARPRLTQPPPCRPFCP